MNKCWEIFFESYNSAVKTAYDMYFESCGKKDQDTVDSSLLQEMLQKKYNEWLAAPLDDLDGMTPAEFIGSRASFEDVAVVFNYGAVICDDELPRIYTDKLRSFGKQAVDFVIRTACRELPAEKEQGFIPQIMAIRTLGRWKAAEAAEPLINTLADEHEAYELLCETVRDALIALGPASVDTITARLETGSGLPETAKEYLLMALAELGRDSRSDKVYSVLKKAFREMADKSVTAACLAQYGDGRAVPALRGYLEKNQQNISRQTFYDIVSAVKRLGGQTGDLRYRD